MYLSEMCPTISPVAGCVYPAYLKDEMLTLDSRLNVFCLSCTDMCMECIRDFCFSDSMLHKCSLNNNNSVFSTT